MNFDNHVKAYRRRERAKEKDFAEQRANYKAASDYYGEQLRRYKSARPDWRTRPTHDFWQNYGNW